MLAPRMLPLLTALLVTASVALGAPADGELKRGERVGWVLPDRYERAARRDEGFLYPDGESASGWTERIRIDRLGTRPTAVADVVLSELAAAYRANCPEFRTQSLFAETVEGVDNAVQMWHCPAHRDDGYGSVVLIKAIVDQSAIYLAQASGRFPPFRAGASPLPGTMLNNWAAFLNSFILCRNRLNPSCLPDPVQLAAAEVAAPSVDEAPSVDLSLARGAVMHRKDQLAQRATRILGAKKDLRWKGKIRGWVTVLDEDGVDVVWFMGGSRRRPRPYYAVVFWPDGPVRFFDYKHYKVSDTALAMFSAREAALAVMKEACTPSVNTVVLEHENGSGWLVYVLSAGTNLNEVHIGGHTRYTVAADGKKVLDTETLSDTCLVLKKSTRRDEDSADEAESWYSMTHLQHATPLETHLFQSLSHQLRFFVHTSAGDWRVENGTISKLVL